MSKSQYEMVNLKLLYGAVDRASYISLFFALSFSVYGLTSHEFIQKVDPSVTLWSNFWPRLLLNGIPFLGIYFWFRNFKERTVLKFWCWIIGYPVIFLSACMIHVWPLMWDGHPQLYLHVHGANFLAMIMAMSLVAPPPKYLWSMVAFTVGLFIVPVCSIFLHLGEYAMLRFFLNDAAYAYFLGILSSHATFRLRNVLATEDVLNQDRIGKFLGQIVSKSIFEKNETLLEPRNAHAFLVSIDVRGFTQLMKKIDMAQASRFKENYHRLVARVVGEFGGFIHKTHGDGHLISLGLMNPEVELADIPGIEGEAEIAAARRQADQLQKAVSIFESVFQQFEKLKEELDIDHEVCVCASIDYGEIGLNILGDPNVRLEFDIEGMVVIRCSRLEAFTKTLREVLASESSFLIVSSSAASYLLGDRSFQVFKTDRHPIKDFPDEAFVAYREYKPAKRIRNQVA